MAHLMRLCTNCSVRRSGDSAKCVQCISDHIRPIEPGYCPVCLDPRPGDMQQYDQCYPCYKENKGKYLNGLISCCYYPERNSEIGYVLMAYKGRKSVPRQTEFAFPLQSLVDEFLSKHLTCINKRFGRIGAIVPIPGVAETLLNRGAYMGVPVNLMLQDGRQGGHYSDGTARGFNATRYTVSSQSVPRTVLLFDDVFTTGSTVHSAAHALRKAGVRVVVAFTIAKHISRTAEYLSDTPPPFDIRHCIFC